MLLFNTVHLSTRGRLLLNKQWGRSPWSTRRSGGRWRPSWRRSNPQSWAGRRPRRRRLLRRHYPVRENEADPVDIAKKDKSEGFGRYNLFIPGQSKKILSLANFERNPLTTAMDSMVGSVVNSMLPSENSFGGFIVFLFLYLQGKCTPVMMILSRKIMAMIFLVVMKISRQFQERNVKKQHTAKLNRWKKIW